MLIGRASKICGNVDSIMDRTFAYVPRNTEAKQVAGKIFKLPGSEFKFPGSALTQPSASVLSSKDLPLMPPPPIAAAPGSLQALFILTPSCPYPSASHSANLNAEMFPVYQALADKDMASVLAMWGLPVRGQSPQKA